MIGAVCTYSQSKTIFLKAGVFSLGESNAVMVTSLRAVYINRISNESDDLNAKEIKQCIIFEADQKIKFIRNDIGTAGMKEYKNRIKEEI